MPRVLQISSVMDDQMTAKIKPQKIPRASNTTPPPQKKKKKNPWIKNQPQKKSHPKFLSLKVIKIFQKAVNDKARKINYDLNVCVCSGIHWHNQESSVCFKYPEKSLFKPSHPKKIVDKFPGIENFKPPKNPLIIPVT